MFMTLFNDPTCPFHLKQVNGMDQMMRNRCRCIKPTKKKEPRRSKDSDYHDKVVHLSHRKNSNFCSHGMPLMMPWPGSAVKVPLEVEPCHVAMASPSRLQTVSVAEDPCNKSTQMSLFHIFDEDGLQDISDQTWDTGGLGGMRNSLKTARV